MPVLLRALPDALHRLFRQSRIVIQLALRQKSGELRSGELVSSSQEPCAGGRNSIPKTLRVTVFAVVCFAVVFNYVGIVQAAHFGYRDLSRDCFGEDVANLQWMLKKMGYYKGEMTGEFDGDTQKAVRMLQEGFGLMANGIVSGETLDLAIEAWTAYQFTEFGYEVKKGDTLSGIARTWGVPLDIIIKLNEIENPDLILPGQRIHIPVHDFGVHVVKEGENLAAICERYGVKPKDLLAWNGLSSEDGLKEKRALIVLDVKPSKPEVASKEGS